MVAVLVVAAALCLGVVGCASHAQRMCEPLAMVYQGACAEAVAAIDKTDVARSGKDKFLYHAQKAHLLHIAGDFELSNNEFERAAAIGDKLEPNSVTETLTDYTVNEAVKAYRGEDFERLYLHYYMALNYMMLGDLKEACVEIQRLDGALRKLDARYEDDDRYQEDGFTRYLSGLVYEGLGDWDDALVDYQKAHRALVPEDLRGNSELAAYVKVAYPELRSVPSRIGRVGARAESPGDQVSVSAERVQDVDALANWILDRRIGAVKFRSTLRATGKQILLAKQKADEKGEIKELQRKINAMPESTWVEKLAKAAAEVGLKCLEDAATVLVAETEQADTRSWVLLPREIWLARIPVDAGEHDVWVECGGRSVHVGSANVGPGEKIFRSCRIFGCPHPVRCETD